METDGCYYFAILFDKNLHCWGETGEESARRDEREKREQRVNDDAAKNGGSFVRRKLCSIVHEKWGKQGEYGIFKTVQFCSG